MHGQKKHDFDSHYDNDNIFVTTTRNHGKKKFIGEMKVKNEQVSREKISKRRNSYLLSLICNTL